MLEGKNEEIEIDLKQLFYVLIGKIWIIILAAALGFGIAAAYTTAFIRPIYSSTSMIYILTKSTSITSLADVQLGSSLTQDYMVFMKSHPVVDTVINDLKLDMTYEEFVSNVSVENPANTRFLNITVQNHDAYMAKKIVDKLTDAGCSKIAEVMETQAPNVLDYGDVLKKPTSPSLSKNALIGALLGFVLASMCIVIVYLMNDSIHTAEDVEKYLGLNTLGLIPLEEGVSKRSTQGHDKDVKKYYRKKRGKRRKQISDRAAQKNQDIEAAE